MSSKQKFTAEEVTQALKDTKGMVYLAAQRLGCEAKTIYNYRDRYASVRAEMEQQDGMVNDIAEMKLYQAIMDGEQWAVVFRLKTKAKDRGYTERQEVTGKDGGPIEHADVTELTDEELARIATHGSAGGSRTISTQAGEA